MAELKMVFDDCLVEKKKMIKFLFLRSSFLV